MYSKTCSLNLHRSTAVAGVATIRCVACIAAAAAVDVAMLLLLRSVLVMAASEVAASAGDAVDDAFAVADVGC